MKDEIRKLIEEGETKIALGKLRSIKTNDDELTNQITLLINRFSEYEKQRINGLADHSTLGIELRQINFALLAIIDALPKDAERSIQDKKSTQKSPASVFSSNLTKGVIITLALAFIGFLGDVQSRWKSLVENKKTKAISSNDNIYIEKPNKNELTDNSPHQKLPLTEVENEGSNRLENQKVVSTRKKNEEFWTLTILLNAEMSGGDIYVDGAPASIVENNLLTQTVKVKKKQGSYHFSIKKNDDICSKNLTISQNFQQLAICQ
jgi:hypothetical protein